VNHLVAGATGKSLFVLSFCLQAAGTVSANFQDGPPTPEQRTPAWRFQAREGLSRSAIEGGFLFGTDTGEGLDVNLSAPVPTNIEVQYVLFPG
jgi:hypothetical protein